ncbi:hypothetical protein C1645_824425 [Glomus cerebriforme]|uniref:F-box domain-containing protein n=1 Tax=Glomus cerebriforme TaxID=658196 RepID=A0A397SVM3_9GLOM|nr:hypothetical protein C1645_824425 [Glomus cerebriforme]
MTQLYADWLYEIFEYLKDDVVTLHSCILVNRLWCKISVKFLWREIRNYNILIDSLPSESKVILYKNGIITSASTPNSLTFNYVSFCKYLSINEVGRQIRRLFLKRKTQSYIHVVLQEIFKLLMSQASLRKLDIRDLSLMQNTIFTSYPNARNCLKDLSELYCYSVCSNGLNDLISVQKNLKCLKITTSFDCSNLEDIITSLKKIPNTSLSFIAKFTNLQKLRLYGPFQESGYLKYEILINSLENNGKNLKELYIKPSNNSLNLAIIKFCPNIRKLFTGMVITKYSPKSFYQLELSYNDEVVPELLPEELESFFVSWADRTPQKPLSLMIDDYFCNSTFERNNKKIFEKYIKLADYDV